jgi:hypothetical protein
MPECDLMGLFTNITHNCANDLEVVKDECHVICLISIVNALNLCYNQLYHTGLLDQLKEVVKWCYYQKYESMGH